MQKSKIKNLNQKSKVTDRFQTGYITLLTVLIVTAVGLAIGTSLLLLGLSASRTSLVRAQASTATALADACVEEALQQIRFSTVYVGTQTLTLTGGNCIFTITSSGAENREVQAVGMVGTVVRKVKVNLNQINPLVNVTAWQEVADF